MMETRIEASGIVFHKEHDDLIIHIKGENNEGFITARFSGLRTGGIKKLPAIIEDLEKARKRWKV